MAKKAKRKDGAKSKRTGENARGKKDNAGRLGQRTAKRRGSTSRSKSRGKSTPDGLELGMLYHMMQSASGEIRPADLLEQHEPIKKVLGTCAPIETASVFGAMLLDPNLQSNCCRLEALVHLSLAAGQGKRIPTQQQLSDCFNELGTGFYGRMEDPAEDVFVSRVITPDGNFRIREGIWESGSFYLQRMLDLVQSLPADFPFCKLRKAVIALLRLSEVVCDRADLPAYFVGSETPHSKIAANSLAKSNRGLVLFDREDLLRLEIVEDDLDPFTLGDQFLPNVRTAPLADSPLLRFPIVKIKDQLALVLPTAVSFAIRTAIVDCLFANGMQDSLKENFANLYAAFFHGQHLLRSFHRVPLRFSTKENLPIAEATAEFDRGYFLHLLFFTEAFVDFIDTGLGRPDPTPTKNIELIEQRVRAAIENFSAEPDFRGGITLLVYCGIGRGILLPLSVEEERWNVEYISAADLFALGRLKSVDAKSLWRILEGVKHLSDLGVELDRMHGLLNLVGWMETNDGHLISHSSAPRELRSSPAYLQLAPNFVLDVRRKAAIEDDARGVRLPNGRVQIVRRIQDSVFPEDRDQPIYSTERFSQRSGIPFVYLSGQRAWWCHVVPVEGDVRGFDRWQMLNTWLPKIVREIEPLLDSSLPKVVLLRVSFQVADNGDASQAVPTRMDIDSAISVSVDAGQSTVELKAAEQFDWGLASPRNISERALVRAICHGLAQLADARLSSDDLEALESRIVHGDEARQMHTFFSRTFRDFPHTDLNESLIRLDKRDNANLRAGMAFRAESRKKGRRTLRSKRTCTKFLNALVRSLEDQLCSDLKLFARADLVEMALRNHEQAVKERELWMRTSSANCAIHSDRGAALAVIAKHDLELNAVLLPSRVLVEFAICQCRATGGSKPSEIDFAKLMTKANAIWYLGGWSDAIHLDAMKPEIVITPLGDVLAETAFESEVLMPFAKKHSVGKIEDAVEQYPDNFETAKTSDAGRKKLDPVFEQAWNDEFGIDFDDLIRFLDSVENLGIARRSAVFRVRRSELISQLKSEVAAETVTRILSEFSLRPRRSWRTVPRRFDGKDIQLWRFRRQLSAVRRPIIQLDLGDDPELVIAPGMIREGVGYVLEGYHEASYPDQFRGADGKLHQRFGKSMQIWYGKRKNQRGSDFAKAVADKVAELGWQVAKPEMKVQEILGVGKTATSGDVSRFGDVDVLAWNSTQKRVLVIECKHLHFHKTAGEVAEQLSDYRGKMKSGGKPDDLLKHLRRLEVLTENKAALAKKIGITTEFSVEGWIVFKNPVPMLHAWAEHESKMRIATWDDIEKILTGDAF